MLNIKMISLIGSPLKLLCLMFLLYNTLLFSCEKKEGAKFQKFYTCEDGDEKLMESMDRQGFQRIYIIYQKHFDADNNVQLEKERFLKKLIHVFPNKKDCGILVLDWEGEVSKILKNNEPNSTEFVNTIHEMATLLDLVHSKRPNVRVGYYGLPFRKRNGAFNQSDFSRYKNFAPIFSKADILFPSVYDMRIGTAVNSFKDGYLYVKNNIEFSLRLATVYDIEVIPFIWHRYHPTVKRNPRGLIPLSEFKSALQAIKDASYKNEMVCGTVWWRSDSRLYNNKQKDIVEQAEQKGGIHKLMESNSEEYSKKIMDIFNPTDTTKKE